MLLLGLLGLQGVLLLELLALSGRAASGAFGPSGRAASWSFWAFRATLLPLSGLMTHPLFYCLLKMWLLANILVL